jgi:hypothetical protein
MKQRNFPQWTREIVAEMYTGASSTIQLFGMKGEAILWNVGVKQD